MVTHLPGLCCQSIDANSSRIEPGWCKEVMVSFFEEFSMVMSSFRLDNWWWNWITLCYEGHIVITVKQIFSKNLVKYSTRISTQCNTMINMWILNIHCYVDCFSYFKIYLQILTCKYSGSEDVSVSLKPSPIW